LTHELGFDETNVLWALAG